MCPLQSTLKSFSSCNFEKSKNSFPKLCFSRSVGRRKSVIVIIIIHSNWLVVVVYFILSFIFFRLPFSLHKINKLEPLFVATQRSVCMQNPNHIHTVTIDLIDAMNESQRHRNQKTEKKKMQKWMQRIRLDTIHLIDTWRSTLQLISSGASNKMCRHQNECEPEHVHMEAKATNAFDAHFLFRAKQMNVLGIFHFIFVVIVQPKRSVQRVHSCARFANIVNWLRRL